MNDYCKDCDQARFTSVEKRIPKHCRNCGEPYSVRPEFVPSLNPCPSCGFEPLYSEKYCQNCGANTQRDQKLCLACNSPLWSSSKAASALAMKDQPDTGIAIISFLLPIIGLILFLAWNSSQPERAGSAGRGALAGVIVGTFIWLIIILTLM